MVFKPCGGHTLQNRRFPEVEGVNVALQSVDSARVRLGPYVGAVWKHLGMRDCRANHSPEPRSQARFTGKSGKSGKLPAMPLRFLYEIDEYLRIRGIRI